MRRTLCVLLAVLALCAGGTTAVADQRVGFALPKPTGPLPIGTTELHLVQPERPDPWVSDRARELMVSIWYPAVPVGPRAPYAAPKVAEIAEREGAYGLPPGKVDWSGAQSAARRGAPALSGAHPVVLFSPGFGNPRALGTIGAQELASRGYVVVTMDHTYEASAVEFPGGRVARQNIPENPPDIEEVKRRAMTTRDDDTRFVLDQLEVLAGGGNPDAERRGLPRDLSGALDPRHIGIFGHSAGGLTAARMMHEDRRLDAGVNLDGWLDWGGTDPSLGVDRPFLLVGAQSAENHPPLLGRPRTHHTSPSWHTFWENSTGWKLDLNYPEGRHYTMTDMQAILPQLAGPLGLDNEKMIGTVDPEHAVRSLPAYVSAFFDRHLRGVPQPLLRGPSPWHPDVTFIR